MSESRPRSLMRDMDAGDHAELFVVSAVAAVLGIRFYLSVTGYPQIGGESLHIAHMLWGGLLMLVAIVVLLSFLSRGAQTWAAVIGGVGFGTFIDEVGKFVTRDNDYFFEPAIAIIYVSLVLTLIGIRMVHERRSYTRDEYLLNAIRELEEVALRDLDDEEQHRALTYLDRSDPDHPLVPALRQAIAETALVPRRRREPWRDLRTRLRHVYDRLSGDRRFVWFVDIFFVGQFALRGLYVWVLLRADELGPAFRWLTLAPPRVDELSLVHGIQIGALVASGLFTLVGIFQIRRSRLHAYEAFKRSVLVSILITQVFAFHQQQMLALLGLALNLVVLGVLERGIAWERDASGD